MPSRFIIKRPWLFLYFIFSIYLEVVSLGHGLGGFFDGDLLRLGNGEDDGVGLGVLAHHPQEESRQIHRVDELTPGLTRSPNDEGLVFGGAGVKLKFA